MQLLSVQNEPVCFDYEVTRGQSCIGGIPEFPKVNIPP